MPAKDTDCKSHSADVEDCAADKQGEETEHSLKKLKLLNNKVFHFLFRVLCIFFWFIFCILLEESGKKLKFLDIKVFLFFLSFPLHLLLVPFLPPS